MPATLKHVRKLEGEHVRLQFQDGREEVALLLCATKDMDGSEHLIYERMASDSPQGESASRCIYANARTLISIEQVPTSAVA